MKKILLVMCCTIALPAIALADNVGGCGWGSKLMDGKSGMFPQVLAVTTNGTSGNQTFGITSGTSGCTKDGTVNSAWKTAAFIDANMNRLALDSSRGEGESLDSLAALLGLPAAQQAVFNATMKANFSKIFPAPGISSAQVADGLRNTLAQGELAQYAANV